jgi:hypothetical protein
MCVTKKGSSFGGGWIAEERIQQAFYAAGEKIPPVTPALSMISLYNSDRNKPPLVQGADDKAGNDYDLRYYTPLWERPHWQIAGLVAVVLSVLGVTWFLGRRGRH